MALALQVRGVCPKCRHVVDTSAPTGRATWRGPCPVRGCVGVVIARRVKELPDQPPEPDQAAQQPPEPAQRGRQRRKPLRVHGYVSGPAETPAGEPPAHGDGADVRGPAEPAPRPPVDPGRAEPVRQPEPERGADLPHEPAQPVRVDGPEHRPRRVTPYDLY